MVKWTSLSLREFVMYHGIKVQNILWEKSWHCSSYRVHPAYALCHYHYWMNSSSVFSLQLVPWYDIKRDRWHPKYIIKVIYIHYHDIMIVNLLYLLCVSSGLFTQYLGSLNHVFHTGMTAVAHWCSCCYFTLPLNLLTPVWLLFNTGVAAISKWCDGCIPIMWQLFHAGVTPFSQLCVSYFTLVWKLYHTGVTAVSHWYYCCFTLWLDFTLVWLFYTCVTGFTLVWHLFHTGVAAVSHCDWISHWCDNYFILALLQFHTGLTAILHWCNSFLHLHDSHFILVWLLFHTGGTANTYYRNPYSTRLTSQSFIWTEEHYYHHSLNNLLQ